MLCLHEVFALFCHTPCQEIDMTCVATALAMAGLEYNGVCVAQATPMLHDKATAEC